MEFIENPSYADGFKVHVGVIVAAVPFSINYETACYWSHFHLIV